MWLFAFFIRRPRGTSLIAIGIALTGIVAWRTLPVGPLPAIDLPTIVLSAALPGAAPETMAGLVATPLERRIGAISGVTELTSVNVLGATQIVVQFKDDRDMGGAANDVQSAINAASAELPKDMPQPPTFQKLNPVADPVLFFAITSDTLPIGDLYDLTKQVIVQKVSQVPGVGAAIIQGAEKSAVRIRADPAALAAMGLGLEDVRKAVAESTVDLPKGSLQGAATTWSIAANDQLFSAESYRALAIANRGGVPVRLGQVASVTDDVSNVHTAGWFNGRRAVFLLVQREAGANLVATAQRVRALLPQIALWLPRSVRIEVLTDRTDSVLPMIDETEAAVLLSCVVVIGVVFIALGSPRAAAIASLNIPVSLLGTLGIMRLLGFSLDLMSIAALTVCVGLVVDDAIVVVENIARLRTEGATRGAAALRGVRQVGFTIVSITLALIATLAPLLLAPGAIGALVGEFAATICIAILLSALLSLTLTPALCAALLPARSRRRVRRGIVLRGYAASLRWSLRHPTVTLGATVAIFAFTFMLYDAIPKGFLPLQDTGLIFGITNARQDISFAAMAERQREVTEIIACDPAVLNVSAYLGAQGVQGATAESVGRVWIALKPPRERGINVEDVVTRLRPRLAVLPGSTTTLQPIEELRQGAREGAGEFQYTLIDESWDELEQWLPRVVDALRGLHSLRDVGTDQRSRGLQARLEIARDKVARLQASPELIDQTLYDAFGQRQIATIVNALDQSHVILETPGADRLDIDALGQVFIPTATGEQVPLRALTRIDTRIAPSLITHQGQFPAATISFNVAPGEALGQAVDDITAAVARLRPPGTLHGKFAGNAAEFELSSFGQPLVFVAALVAVYIVLGVLYESYIHPVTILSTLPSAGLGALLGLMLFGMQLTVVSFIGLLLLTGIVKKNAIILVDFALDATRRRDLDATTAIFDACLDRFRPILMTSITAIFGALPLVLTKELGAEFRQPLGVAIAGGLLVSQVLTLYTTPIIYVLLDRFRRPRQAPSSATQ